MEGSLLHGGVWLVIGGGPRFAIGPPEQRKPAESLWLQGVVRGPPRRDINKVQYGVTYGVQNQDRTDRTSTSGSVGATDLRLCNQISIPAMS